MTLSTSKLPSFRNPSACKLLICRHKEGLRNDGRVLLSLLPYARARLCARDAKTHEKPSNPSNPSKFEEAALISKANFDRKDHEGAKSILPTFQSVPRLLRGQAHAIIASTQKRALHVTVKGHLRP
jgi:hypothetical protein